eukprot:TRINITY_DN26849_c0_g1_i1.p2 TRINITY_DN26849_c0_g1~~TRINITY_DN26849_c0_g1_i1.p2  ORF type:complete len:170 (+),score=28.85 TRINITY_DN26849_c0_g1_i1:40-510(+)
MVLVSLVPCRVGSGRGYSSFSSVAGNRVSRVRVNCAAPAPLATEVATETKELLQINKDNFFEFIQDEKNGVVVVDFYTDWCGPCKMIYPALVELNEQYGDDVSIVKFNCNAYNKELGKELKIKVAPTFHVYKSGDKVAEMSGANVERLKELIENSM